MQYLPIAELEAGLNDMLHNPSTIAPRES